ncbi:hypothetical protein [Thermaerobacter litoralis]
MTATEATWRLSLLRRIRSAVDGKPPVARRVPGGVLVFDQVRDLGGGEEGVGAVEVRILQPVAQAIAGALGLRRCAAAPDAVFEALEAAWAAAPEAFLWRRPYRSSGPKLWFCAAAVPRPCTPVLAALASLPPTVRRHPLAERLRLGGA